MPAFTKEAAGPLNYIHKVSNFHLVYKSFLLNFVEFYIPHGKIMLFIVTGTMDTNFPADFGIAVIQIQIWF